jgi:hypothetical protein
MSTPPPTSDGPAPHWRLALALYLAACFVLAWPWVSGAVTIPWDAKAHFQPQLAFLARALHSGQSPFWTPNVFAGSPQIADPQSLIFSPPYLVLALAGPEPSFRAADATLFAMLALGGLGFFGLFRDRGWRAEGAMVAALAFAFGGSAAWRIQHVGQVLSIAWFPLTLWLLARALARGSAGWGLAAGVVAGLMALGRDQVAFLCALALTAFVVHDILGRGWGARLRAAVKPLAAGLVGGTLVVALPLALTLDLAAQSNRPAFEYEDVLRGSLHPGSLLTLFVADLFGLNGPLKDFWGPPSPVWGPTNQYLARNMGALYAGALPALALLIVGLARGQALSREIRLFALAALVMLAYALGRYTPVFHVAFHLPGVDFFRRPADATFVFGALAALTAGWCAHRALADDLFAAPRRRLPAIALTGLVLAVAALTALSRGKLAASALAIASGASFLMLALLWLFEGARLSRARPRVAMVALAALMTLDLAVGNRPNESTGLPPQDYDILRADTRNDTIRLLKGKLAEGARAGRRDRVELAGLGFHWPNAGLVHDMDNLLGYNPIRLKLFVAATGALDHVALPEQRVFTPFFPSYGSVAADLFGLRYIALGAPAETIDPSLKPGDLTLIARTGDGYVYENPRALPRAFVAETAIAVDFTALLKDGKWPAFDPRNAVLLEKPDRAAGAPVGDGPARAQIVEYVNTRVRVGVDAPRGGWLVLNDVWHPGWIAALDGAPAEILRANGVFRAVALPPGTHEVAFEFRPLQGLWRPRRGE